MTGGVETAAATISPEFVEDVCSRLASDRPVRRRLPAGGRIAIDRRLPFLCIHRMPVAVDDGQTARLVVGEAAYLIASGDPKHHAELTRLVTGIARTMSAEFGAFLLIEIWAAREESVPVAEKGEAEQPTFRVETSTLPDDDATVRNLARALSRIPLRPPPLDVVVATVKHAVPPELEPLLPSDEAVDCSCHTIGIEIQPVYREAKTGIPYPAVHRTLRRGLTTALRKTFFHFALTHTKQHPEHYHVFGRRGTPSVVWEIDRQLTEVSVTFDFLLQVTPVNADSAWTEFRRQQYDRDPVFDYRPLVVDTALLKRQLYDIRIDEIDDPTLAHMLSDTRQELDRKVTMLGDRNTPNFLYGSLQVFGGVDDDLLALARNLLALVSPTTTDSAGTACLGAREFARRAEEEIAHYRVQYPELKSCVKVRDDINGLMVSSGNLLIGSGTMIPESRVEALLQHEIGTHVVTFANGSAQPLAQLASGLAGYEELQEGLGVVSEFAVGGLSRPRLRLLAARVVAVHSMIKGGTFIDVFRELTGTHGYRASSAFTICMRVFRSGGLSKDAVYLRGLAALLGYLRRGGDMEPLLVGKIALAHVPMVRELLWRQVLRPPQLQPRYISTAAGSARLARLRAGLTVPKLLDENAA
ncbi:MAG: flavohemoglobin expression-modulating QEGLA motif protein [Gemmatimonadaceae bacterium]